MYTYRAEVQGLCVIFLTILNIPALILNDAFYYSQDENDEENSSKVQEPVPRNFVINRDPYEQPPPASEEAPVKQPPPPPPIRTRPSGITGRLKPSDSSFGLHSPDNLPVGFNPQDDKVQVCFF